MAHLIEIPPADGHASTVREWLAAEDTSLAAGDPIVDLAIDGTECTITAPVDGILSHRLVSEDESADPGDRPLDEDVLERIVAVGERTCHVAELLREGLPIDLSWELA